MSGHLGILIMTMTIQLASLSDPKTLHATGEYESNSNNFGKQVKSEISKMNVETPLGEFSMAENGLEVEDLVSEESNSQNYSYYTFQDTFECLPCICFRDESDVVTAECSSRRIRNLPNNLPISLRSLNMTDISLREFDTASVRVYSHMTSLVVNLNRMLNQIYLSEQVNISLKLKILDLEHNNISTILNGSFRCYVNLRELMLGFNRLVNITAAMFEGLNNLKRLSLSNNKIIRLQEDTFNTLESLEFLDLSRNSLIYNDKSIPPLLFEKLVNLKYLYLQGNDGTNQLYPQAALSKLVALTHLYIDVNLRSKLGPSIKKLKNLTSLTLGGKFGNCKLRNITRDFLENVPYLKTFVVFGCRLYNINTAVYKTVERLHTLDIRETSETYDLDVAFNDLQGLVNSSLKILRLISLTHSNGHLCRALGKVQAEYLQHIQLEELDLSENHIVLVDYDFARLLPKTLKKIVLKDNKLITKVFALITFSVLTDLTEIHLDRQNMQTYRAFQSVNDNGLNDQRKLYNLGYSDTEVKGYDKYNAAHQDDSNDEITVSAIIKVSSCPKAWHNLHDTELRSSMPPNLKTVRGSRFHDFDKVMLKKDWGHPNSLTDITLTNNFLIQWGEGILPRGLQKVDLSNNYCMKLKPNFILPNNSLVFLNISNNIVGDSLAADVKGEIFAFADQLRVLDLSMNLIEKLPRDVFVGLESIEVLLLSNNKIRALNISLSHMYNLRLLNFSRNSIIWIDKVTRDDLDILSVSKDVHLDLTFNPLPCTCDGVEVLNWMANTNIKFLNQMFLKCQTDSGEMATFGDLRKRAQEIKRLCASRAIVLVISVSFSVCIVIFFSLALLYRYRWKLRYLWNVAIAKIGGFKPNYVLEEHFHYDAYILYEDKTIGFVFKHCILELEVKRGHRLLLADRDIMPGSYMTSAILSAVQNSYKTVPIFTPDFYNGAYSEYAVKMAVMEEIYGPRPILHVCLLQPPGPEGMSKDFLSVMHKNHYTEYPPDEDLTAELVDHFWDQFSDSIRQMR